MNKHKIRFIFFGTVLLILFFLIGIVGFDNGINNRAILGLRAYGQEVGGLNNYQIEQKLDDVFIKSPKPLKLRYKDQVFQIIPSDVGFKADPYTLTREILKKGRTGSVVSRLSIQFQSLLGQQNVETPGSFSQTLLTLKILQLQDQIDTPAKPIMPDFVHDLNKTLPAQEGVKIPTDKLTLLIINNIFNSPDQPIDIPTFKTFTSHQEEELAPIRKQAQELTKEAVSITSGSLTFTLSPDDLRSMLTLVERSDPDNPRKLILQLRLDDKKLNKKLGEFAFDVETITHAEFDDHDARTAIYSQFYKTNRHLVKIPTVRALRNNVLGEETPGGEKVAYLTFDDGPNSIYHPLILNILKKYNIKATFFLVGLNSQKDADVAKRTKAEGHNLGNHSLTHSFLPNLTNELIVKELQTTADILKPFNNNQDIKLFRPPYGGVNQFVQKAAQDLGLKLILWDVDPRDWSEPAVDELVRRVTSNTINGSDILLHSNHKVTVQALPKIIESLQASGFTLKTLQ